MHQIRVHLQYLGHPILNDIAYGGQFVGNKIIEKLEFERDITLAFLVFKLEISLREERNINLNKSQISILFNVF